VREVLVRSYAASDHASIAADSDLQILLAHLVEILALIPRQWRRDRCEDSRIVTTEPCDHHEEPRVGMVSIWLAPIFSDPDRNGVALALNVAKAFMQENRVA